MVTPPRPPPLQVTTRAQTQAWGLLCFPTTMPAHQYLSHTSIPPACPACPLLSFLVCLLGFPSFHPQTEPPVLFKAPDHILRLNDFITNCHYCVVSSRNVLLLLLLSARHSIWAVKNQFLGTDSRSRHFCAHSTTMICLLSQSQLTFLDPLLLPGPLAVPGGSKEDCLSMSF